MHLPHSSRASGRARLRRPPRVGIGAALAVAGLAGLTALSGCSAGADDGRTDVVASFYPLGFLAERIGGQDADVEVLTSPGTEPHDLELELRQIADVARAEVVVYSRGLQPAVDDAVDQSENDHVVDAAEVAHLVPPDESSAGHDEGHDEGHDHGDEALDPHFWLDPERMADVAAAVEQQLAAADPGHAGAYAAHLRRLQADLGSLDEEIRTGLADCERNQVVVSHDAFGYFADRYGLDVVAINGLSPDAEPSPAHLRELSDLIRRDGITTVFSETLASPELADTLAGELGLRTAVLDPIEGLGDSTSGEDYLSLMRANLRALQEANGCR